MVVQPARLGDLHDAAMVGAVHRSRFRAVHGERAVAAPAVIVLEVVAEEPAQVALVKNYDVVQALASDAADQTLDERVLPGASGRGENLFDPHALDPILERGPVDAVSIPEQVARRLFPGKRIGDLLGGPLRRRTVCDVEVNDPARL